MQRTPVWIEWYDILRWQALSDKDCGKRSSIQRWTLRLRWCAFPVLLGLRGMWLCHRLGDRCTYRAWGNGSILIIALLVTNAWTFAQSLDFGKFVTKLPITLFLGRFPKHRSLAAYNQPILFLWAINFVPSRADCCCLALSLHQTRHAV
jgi:hypothetical protein